MQIIKGEPDEYGWYWKAHIVTRGDPYIRIYYRSVNRKVKFKPSPIIIRGDGMDITLKAIKLARGGKWTNS